MAEEERLLGILQALATRGAHRHSARCRRLLRHATKCRRCHQQSARFVRGLRSWVGFRQTGMPYARAARAGGDPKYTWRRLTRLALEGVIAFSEAPLRLAADL